MIIILNSLSRWSFWQLLYNIIYRAQIYCMYPYVPYRRPSLKSNKDEHAEKLSQEAYRLYRTVQSIIHTKEPDLVQHLTPCYSTLFEKNSNSSVSVWENLTSLFSIFFFVFSLLLSCFIWLAYSPWLLLFPVFVSSTPMFPSYLYRSLPKSLLLNNYSSSCTFLIVLLQYYVLTIRWFQTFSSSSTVWHFHDQYAYLYHFNSIS